MRNRQAASEHGKHKERDRQTSRELFESEEPDSICPWECQGISYQATQTNHINIKE
jgi:hypothetical protein